MPEVVGEGDRFRQILIDPKTTRNGARDLGYLQGVGQARPEMIARRGQEHLGLARQPSEGLALMDDPIAVALEGRPHGARLLRPLPPTRLIRLGGELGKPLVLHAFYARADGVSHQRPPRPVGSQVGRHSSANSGLSAGVTLGANRRSAFQEVSL
jgi:hypothetical protein